MQTVTLDMITDPEYWDKNQKEPMGCGSFCEKYFPLVLSVAHEYNPKVMESTLTGHHFWIEFMKNNKRFIIDASIPKSIRIGLFFVGFLDDCNSDYLSSLYNSGEQGRVALIIEKKVKEKTGI